MLVVGFPTGWGRRAGGIRSRRCGEKQLEQWVRCAGAPASEVGKGRQEQAAWCQRLGK